MTRCFILGCMDTNSLLLPAGERDKAPNATLRTAPERAEAPQRVYRYNLTVYDRKRLQRPPAGCETHSRLRSSTRSHRTSV